MATTRRVRFPWTPDNSAGVEYPRQKYTFKLDKDNKLPEIDLIEDAQEQIDSAGIGFTIYDIMKRVSKGEIGLISKYHLDEPINTQGLDMTKLPEDIFSALDAEREAREKIEQYNQQRQQVQAVPTENQGMISATVPPVESSAPDVSKN